ncbi:MAG: YdcF family protein [Rhizomicrobium sp.]
MIWKIVLGVVGAYVLGFVIFVATLPAPVPAPKHVDAIVALTGEEKRVDAAVSLLEDGVGKRLLITGVHKEITKDELKRVAHGGRRFDCCADMGYQAEDTQGNADEAAGWARAHGYKSLVVVTTNYHMPRSLTEFSSEMPGVKLEPYPVESGEIDYRHWWESPRALRVLNIEYAKYLVSAVLVRLFPPKYRPALDRAALGGKVHRAS